MQALREGTLEIRTSSSLLLWNVLWYVANQEKRRLLHGYEEAKLLVQTMPLTAETKRADYARRWK
jgi:hypothetical protein